ncbi:hypothetical protein UFOVP1351_2 [uncultured Caudovirales phage]|uniref:Uncharacterized protein n=1 Tax=uncultured Caudovirales phage TaxID=2100421 RepID=A0A6J5RZ45_9CAUD|nr:hypothetical protein UFOVP1351_2 [uncultured Caudovirales phage]
MPSLLRIELQDKLRTLEWDVMRLQQRVDVLESWIRMCERYEKDCEEDRRDAHALRNELCYMHLKREILRERLKSLR